MLFLSPYHNLFGNKGFEEEEVFHVFLVAATCCCIACSSQLTSCPLCRRRIDQVNLGLNHLSITCANLQIHAKVYPRVKGVIVKKRISSFHAMSNGSVDLSDASHEIEGRTHQLVSRTSAHKYEICFGLINVMITSNLSIFSLFIIL